MFTKKSAPRVSYYYFSSLQAPKGMKIVSKMQGIPGMEEWMMNLCHSQHLGGFLLFISSCRGSAEPGWDKRGKPGAGEHQLFICSNLGPGKN